MGLCRQGWGNDQTDREAHDRPLLRPRHRKAVRTMIRTLIEVSAETEWEHSRQLDSALEKLGFEQKQPSRDMWFRDLADALRDRGIEAHAIVEELRGKRMAEDLAASKA